MCTQSPSCAMVVWAFGSLCSALLSLTAQAATREELPLNGVWQAVKVQSLDTQLPADGWKDTVVPGVLQGYNYERAWFRRSFTVDDGWKGKSILLRFGGVKFRSRVWVNNKEVGECLNGYDPFELDVTDAIRFGEQNELLVGLYDWTGLFDGERLNLPDHADWTTLRIIPRDCIVAPIGGRFDLYGIWDDVSLLAVPQVHITDCFVRPSIRRSRLSVDVTVANTGVAARSQVQLGNERPDNFRGNLEVVVHPYNGSPRDAKGVWPVDGTPVAVSGPAPIEVPPGQERAFTLELENPPLELWWPHSPKLYIVEVRIDGADGDQWQERIGFREFWTEGGDFYLNGVKVHLLARSWWPPDQPYARDAIAAQIRMLKEMNVNCFRTHTQPWPSGWYEAADELGLMMIPEGAVFKDDEAYRVNDSRFWDAYARHLRAMVRHLRNHPSVIMWSLENEFHGLRAKDGTSVEEKLAEMGRIVKEVDPVRPIVFESDGDPGGVADVIGLHYPNEYPERRLWPNDAFWMDKPNASRHDKMFWDQPYFLWDRAKPLYIGEFLWVPDDAPSTATLFFGDEVYISPRTYHFRAKAEAWRMQILAYRHYEVSGFAPWGYDYIKPDAERKVVLLTQRDMFRPLAAFPRECDHRFFAGELVERTVELFNDTMSPHSDARLEWAILEGNRAVGSGNLLIDLPAGAHKETSLKVTMPEVQERTPLSLRLSLHSEGQEQFREEWPIDVFPRYTGWSLPDAALFVYDPEKELVAALEQGGVKFQTLEDPDAWRGDGVLIVGARTSKAGEGVDESIPVIGPPRERYKRLLQRVRAGGRVLVLAQTSDAADCLPVQLTTISSTMAFSQMPGHPILRPFQPGDFCWWRGDHMVSRQEPARPVCGAARPLVVTGTAQGISHAPLLEMPEGDGVWLICQLLVQRKLHVEPVAHKLLEQMIRYLADYRAPRGSTVFHGPVALATCLDRCSVDYKVLDVGGWTAGSRLGVGGWTAGSRLRDWSALGQPQVRLLILQADGATISEHAPALRSFLEAGGNVLLHRPQQHDFTQVCQALNLPIQFQPFRGPVIRSESRSPWVEALTREDLYWFDADPRSGPGKVTQAKEMADGVFVPAAKSGAVVPFEAEQGARLEGPVVKIQGGEVVFGSNGTARWRINIPETGSYSLSLVARGTPCANTYPTAEISLDGKTIGIIEVNRSRLESFTAAFDANQGEHELAVSFTNDGKSATEDRNLYLDRIAFAKQSEDSSIEALTVPPALVRIPIGKGSLLLNAIRWDEPGGNALRADRFASALLGSLGARFRAQPPVAVLEAEALQPNPGIAAFVRTQDHVLFGANGYIEQSVRVAQQGRYRFVLWSKGTAVAGVYPVVSVQLNERELGRIECVGESWGPHDLLTDLPPGPAVLRFAFTNDARRPPEDRNLWLDRIEIEHIESDF